MEANAQRQVCFGACDFVTALLAYGCNNPGGVQSASWRDVAILHRFYVFLG